MFFTWYNANGKILIPRLNEYTRRFRMVTHIMWAVGIRPIKTWICHGCSNRNLELDCRGSGRGTQERPPAGVSPPLQLNRRIDRQSSLELFTCQFFEARRTAPINQDEFSKDI